MDRLDHTDTPLTIADGLTLLCEVQREGAQILPDHLLAYDEADFRTAALGAFVELGELVNECQWKPWRQTRPLDQASRRKILKEAGDLLHFFAWMMNNLGERFGIAPEEFARGFCEAAEENRRRFRGEVPGREPPTCDGLERDRAFTRLSQRK